MEKRSQHEIILEKENNKLKMTLAWIAFLAFLVGCYFFAGGSY